MEHTTLALWVGAWMTDLFADVGWLKFQSIYLSVHVTLLYTVVCIVWLGFGVHLVPGKGMLPSLPGYSIVNFMWLSILFIWLQNVHLVFFSYADYIIHISFHHGMEMGIVVPVPVLQNIPCKYLLWLVRLENPLLLPEVACKICVGMRTHSCSTYILGEQ